MKKRILACLLVLCMLMSGLPVALSEEANEAPAHKHSYSVTSETAASCTEAGSKTYVCDCGDSYTEKIDKKGHDWSSWDVTVEADCTQTGSKTRVCGRCGETETETISVKDHDWQLTSTQEPTCTEAGSKLFTCAVCGKEKTEEIAAPGHDYGEAVVTIGPACETAGEKTSVCAVCGKEKKEEIAALGHEWDEGVETLAPTCEAKGEKTFTCARCSGTKTEEIAALGHAWDEGVVALEPACETAGEKLFTCARCEGTKTEEIAALGHEWDEGVISLEPACETAGEKLFTCARCEGTKTEAIPALGHTLDEGVETTAPTCTEDGVKTFTCSVCGAVVTEAIPALGHALDEGVETLPATCTEAGLMTYTCTVCGETVTEEIPALGHDIVDNICTRCGYTRAAQIGDTVYQTVEEALAAAQKGDLVTVYVASGDIILPAGVSLKPECKGVNVLPAEGCALVFEDGIYTCVEAVAAIGDVRYAELQEALDAAQDGDIVTLLKNTTVEKGVTVKKAVVLDFDGNVLMGKDLGEKAAVLTVSARKKDVVLKDGAIRAKGEAKYLVQNDASASLTLDKMELDISDNEAMVYALSNNARDVILTGKTELTAAMPEEGRDMQFAADAYGDKSTLILDNDFEGAINGAVKLYKYDDELPTFSKRLTILAAGYQATREGDYVFIEKVKASLLEALMEDVYVAQIGSDKYTSIEAAMENAYAGCTLTLLADITEESIDISATSMTVDFNGKKIEPVDEEGEAFDAVTVIKTCNVTLKDSAYASGTSRVSGVYVGSAATASKQCYVTIESGIYSGSVVTAKYGNLEIIGGTFEKDPSDYVDTDVYEVVESTAISGWYEVREKSFEAVAEVHYADGTVEAFPTVTAAAAAADEGDTIVIVADVVEEDVVIANSCTLDINGKELVLVEADQAITVTGSNVTIMDSAETCGSVEGVYVKGSSNSKKAAATIESGCFTGEVSAYSLYSTLTITGGTFTADPSAYVPYGYLAVKQGDENIWIVNEDTRPDVAEVFEGTTSKGAYKTVTDAVNAAAAGDTVKLISANTIAEDVSIAKSITIDVNGSALVPVNANVAITVTKGTVTIVNSAEADITSYVDGLYANGTSTSNAGIVVESGNFSGDFVCNTYGSSIVLAGGYYDADKRASHVTVADGCRLAEGYYTDNQSYYTVVPTDELLIVAVYEGAAHYYMDYKSVLIDIQSLPASSTGVSVTLLKQLNADDFADAMVGGKFYITGLPCSLSFNFNYHANPAIPVVVTAPANGTLTLLDTPTTMAGSSQKAIDLKMQAGSFNIGTDGNGLLFENGLEFGSGRLHPASGTTIADAEVTIENGTVADAIFGRPVVISGDVTIDNANGVFGGTMYVPSGSTLTVKNGNFMRGCNALENGGSVVIEGGYFGGDPYRLLGENYTSELITSGSKCGYWHVAPVSEFVAYRDSMSEIGYIWGNSYAMTLKSSVLTHSGEASTFQLGDPADAQQGLDYISPRRYYYRTLAEAVEAPETAFNFDAAGSANGLKLKLDTKASGEGKDTIHLIKDVTVDDLISIGAKQIVIDFGGHTVNYTTTSSEGEHLGGYDLFELSDEGGELTLKDGTISIDTSGDDAGAIYINATATVNLVNIDLLDTGNRGAWSESNKYYLISCYALTSVVNLDKDTYIEGAVPVDPESQGTIVPEVGARLSDLPFEGEYKTGKSTAFTIDRRNGSYDFLPNGDGYIFSAVDYVATVEDTYPNGDVVKRYFTTIAEAAAACSDDTHTYVLTVVKAYAETITMKDNLTVKIDMEYLDTRTVFTDANVDEDSKEAEKYTFKHQGKQTGTDPNDGTPIYEIIYGYVYLVPDSTLEPGRGLIRSTTADTDGRYSFTQTACAHLYTVEHLTGGTCQGYCPNCGKKVYSYINLTAECDVQNYFITFPTVGADNWVRVGETVDIVAPDKSGAGNDFEGWYVQAGQGNRDFVSESRTATITVGEEDRQYIAIYQSNNHKCIVNVTSTGAGFIIYTNKTTKEAITPGTSGYEFAAGTRIYIEAVDKDSFGAWTNQNNYIMSLSPTFSYVVVSNMDLKLQAKTGGSTATAWVQFNSTDGQILGGGHYSVESIVEMSNIPTIHARMNETFLGWRIQSEGETGEIFTKENNYAALKAHIAELIPAAVEAAQTIVVIPALQIKAGEFKVVCQYYTGNTPYSDPEEFTYQLGTNVDLNVDPEKTLVKDGREYVFSHYEVQEDANKGYKVASYYNKYSIKPLLGSKRTDKPYTLYVRIIYELAKPSAPVGIVRASEKYVASYGTAESPSANKRLSSQFEFSVPEGCTIVERGVLYTWSGDLKDKSRFRLSIAGGGTGGSSAINKATFAVSNKLRCGTMTLNIKVPLSDFTVATRGFIVYTYKEGNVEKRQEVYSDEIFSFCYDDLKDDPICNRGYIE